jgi:hypothetical protein
MSDLIFGFMVFALGWFLSRAARRSKTRRHYGCWHELRRDLMPESDVPIDEIVRTAGGATPPNYAKCRGWTGDDRQLAAWVLEQMSGPEGDQWCQTFRGWRDEGRTVPPPAEKPFETIGEQAARAKALERAKNAFSHICKNCREAHGPDDICMGLVKGAHELGDSHFVPGIWVRVLTGEHRGGLFRTVDSDVVAKGRPGDILLEDASHDRVFVPLSAVEWAAPLPGEAWVWVRCPRHPNHHVPDDVQQMVQTCPPLSDPSRRPAHERECIDCGCLYPYQP